MTPAGVGLCLGDDAAVIAVVHTDPLRLAAIASVTWPQELWQPDAPPYLAMAAGQRVLASARRRLGLPRWCPVAVVAGPSLSYLGTQPEWLAPRAAQLLARAAMAQGWVIAPERAAKLRAGTPLTVAGELGEAMAGAPVDADLAVGAAIAMLRPPEPVAPRRVDPAQPGVAGLIDLDRAPGWAVQRVES